ncbi:MAG: B12-binding domain-containing radical SAM protein [Bacteroidetes bacterium]|nr:B12-binding domain-containing radical SAM protein [Bacteroidota bacterium]
MKIILIQPPQKKIDDDRMEYPLGLMYLSAILKQGQHDVSILDFSGGFHHDIPQADFYGFSTFTPAYSWCLQKRDEIAKKYPKAKFMAGGPHVSALPNECSSDWNAVIVGEGETAINDIINGQSGIIYGNSMEIDKIPFPDYDNIDAYSYTRTINGQKTISFLTSRGCSYSCAFCNSIVVGSRCKPRLRNPELVKEEILYIRNKYSDISSYRIVDDLFVFNEQRVECMTKMLRPLNIQYRCNGRVNIFNDNIAKLLVSSGCDFISFGVESGSDDILCRMNKKQTANDTRKAVRSAKNAGLKVRCYLVVGFPGETWDTVKQTISLMLETKPDDILIFATIPFPGTPLYHYPERFGINWISKDFDNYLQIISNKGSNYLFSHSSATAEEIKKMRTYMIDKLVSIAWVK